MEEKYKFRREDTGEIVEVDYKTMIQHSLGWITLPDGTQAKRVHDSPYMKMRGKTTEAPHRMIVSDAIGFGLHQLEDFERDRTVNGFSGIEFRIDPSCDKFVQVTAKSRAEFDRYVAHRGCVDQNSGASFSLTQDDLDQAKKLVLEKHVQWKF